MKLYHGTISTGAENIIKNGIKLERGKPKVDFGQDFILRHHLILP